MPKNRYKKEMQSEEFTADPAQMLVVEQLHALEHKLLNLPASGPGLGSRVKKLLSKKKTYPSCHSWTLYLWHSRSW